MALVQLPSVLVQEVVEETATGYLVVNRTPDVDEESVPLSTDVDLEVYNADGAAPAATSVTISIGGVIAHDAAGLAPGWDGVISNPDASTVRFHLTPPEPWSSDQLVAITVDVDDAEVASWWFNTVDQTPPSTLSAVALDKKLLRITFSEEMRQVDASAGGDALNPSAYTIDRASRPAVNLQVLAVESVSPTEVDLILDIEMTFGAAYELTVSGLLDIAGNAHVVAPDNVVEFAGFLPPFPAGRRFLLADFIPAMNHAEDATEDLAKVLSCVQEVTNVLLCTVDEWGRILDPDVAPEQFVDAMLTEMGNPFTAFELSEVDKRRLLRVLVRLYQLKGTQPGIVAAVLFFTGVDVTVRTYAGTGFVIGSDTVGSGVLGPDQAGLYSYKVVSPVVLTAAQRTQIQILAEYMQVAHEHYLGTVEPFISVPPDHVVLGQGYSRLGGTGSVGTFVLNA